MVPTVTEQMEDEIRAAAEEHGLTPSEGFFFGSQDYNWWYVCSLRDTVEIIDKALAIKALDDATTFFRYCASW